MQDNGKENLEAMFKLADAYDTREGKVAYERYHLLMQAIANHYNWPLYRVVAAFAALSPNNDYVGNLRSLVSVHEGVNKMVPIERIIVSTYKHCAVRAHRYVTGEDDFEKTVKGPKIRNFYFNIMDPTDDRWVTIDGHMSAAWQGLELNMKEALIKGGPKEYKRIADAMKDLAQARSLLPHQYQAILWFTRKRILRIKYESQVDIFAHADGDIWKIMRTVESIVPFPLAP